MAYQLLECSVFEPSDEIRQGTIIKFDTEKEDEKIGIIVTGDCDIAQNKHGKYLSYCNIISLDSYILNYFIQKKCQKKIAEKLKCLKSQIQDSLHRELSDSAFRELLQYDKETLRKIISKNSLINEIIDLQPFCRKTEFSINDYITICNQKKKEFENEVKNFPGDKFFIATIPDPECETEGFVVNLRRIREIKREDISVRYFGSTPSCFVLGKLNSPYKEKLAQALGCMFSDLGLPVDFENERNNIISKISGDYVK